jgi:hypothetical protein
MAKPARSQLAGRLKQQTPWCQGEGTFVEKQAQPTGFLTAPTSKIFGEFSWVDSKRHGL